MPRFILINEQTRHACYADRDTIRRAIDFRSNPAGGYTDVDRCMAMIENPESGKYQAFPFQGPMGPMSIHVDGRMDYKGSGLEWKEAGHQCDLRCLLPGMPRRGNVSNPELRGNER